MLSSLSKNPTRNEVTTLNNSANKPITSRFAFKPVRCRPTVMLQSASLVTMRVSLQHALGRAPARCLAIWSPGLKRANFADIREHNNTGRHQGFVYDCDLAGC